jgi:chaperonin GroES
MADLPMNTQSLQPNAYPRFAPQMPADVAGGMAGGTTISTNIQSGLPPEMAETPRSPEEEALRLQEMEYASYRDQLSAFASMVNVAEKIDGRKLQEIGNRVVEEYLIDCSSRQEWLDNNREYIELARLIGKSRTYGDGIVANVKYPTLAMAALQFAARSYPNIIPGADVVKGKKVGADPDGSKQRRADRMAAFMSWQLTEQMEGWDEDTDRMLTMLPVVGCAFRKTYRNLVDDVNVSELVPCEDLVVNYFAKSIESTPRITQHVALYPNEIVERVRGGRFLDVELGPPVPKPEIIKQHQDSRDYEMPHLFLEQHRWEDLDDDGYREPYVITVHYDTRQVVRIIANYDIDGVQFNEKQEIVRIKPVQYFTRYIFFPAFDGGFYGMGFGSLLGPINKTVNTTINQLLDAGTQQNRQCGFLGSGIRMPDGMKTVRFKSGEWKAVANTGEDLRKNVFPLPAHPPSPVLFQLLEFMVTAAKELASNAEVLSGNQPRANVPATTTLALIEQGLKVYSSIYLRIHKSLKRELQKLKRLNRLFVTDEEYRKVLDDAEATVDDFYDDDLDVVPVSDVADLNDMQKIMKAQALREMLGQGLNDMEINKRFLQALNVPDIPSLLTAPEPKVDPRVQIEQIKANIRQTELALKDRELQLKEQVEAVKADKTRSDANLVDERALTLQLKREIDSLKYELDRERQQLDILMANSESRHKEEDRALEERKLEVDQKSRGLSNENFVGRL